MARAPESVASAAESSVPSGDDVFDLGTELGRDLAAVDWSATPMGPVATWSASLRNIVRLQLGSRFAMWMAWGPDLTFLCNDAYRIGTLGTKYPWALGRSAREVWAEIWPDIGPRIDTVIATGVATWDEGLMLFLQRSGYSEETYHTFSYSPLTGDDGRIQGMLCVVSEETARVIAEARMATVRDLGTALAAASTQQEVCAAAERILASDGRNLPFALGYFFDADRASAQLAFSAGVTGYEAVAPEHLDVADEPAGGPGAGRWPARELVHGRACVVELSNFAVELPTGSWDEPPTHALVVPFTEPGERRPFGFGVAALNPYRLLDDDYRGFIELIAGQVAAAVTRARAYEQELRRSEQLAELDRAKTTFFTNVSHELRTPLTLLLGPAADALSDQQAPLPATQRGRVEVITRNAERLLKLVNTLLDFSRLESGRVQAQFRSTDLASYTAELAAMFDSTLSSAGLRFVVACEPVTEPVFVDREMWAKIVLNLLSNAFKATFVGEVTLRLRQLGDTVELSVADTGIGISAADQEHLFERFHRVLGATQRTHEGSGIGLALVAELAGLHGGGVTLESEVGQGSTFTVTVRTGRDHLPPEQVLLTPTAEQQPLAQYGAGYLAEASRWTVEPVLPAGEVMGEAEGDWSAGAWPDEDGSDGDWPAGDGYDGGWSADTERDSFAERRRVLVVEDNPDMRDYIAGLLRPHYRIRTAENGAEGLRLATAAGADLVLTDVTMPELDGFGLLGALRNNPRTAHIPVVMLSARSGDDATVEGLEAGAEDYLVKPFTARELLARVRANLELDRVRRVAAQLRRSRQLLNQAEQLARTGSWELDLRDDRITGSAEFFRLLGVAQSSLETGGLETALAVVHPADRDAARAALRQTIRAGAPLDLVIRLQTKEERYLRVRAVLRPSPEKAQRPTQDPVRAFAQDDDGRSSAGVVRGSVQDITDQRRAEHALALEAAAREAVAREHAIAEELQRSLLPGAIGHTDSLDLAAYYVAGVAGTQAGGDWYDVIALADGRSALVIGDVMGRGVRAAAVMGQLRAMVKAYAQMNLEPGAVLTWLDAAVSGFVTPMIVTCFYAIHDPKAGTLTYASAGHLPPLLTRPGAASIRLDRGEPPLGTGLVRGGVETVPFGPGDRLTLYTDGLVEHRGSEIDAGIDRLAELLDTARVSVDALPGFLVDTMLPSDPDDDVAILVAGVATVPRGPAGSIKLPSQVTSVRVALGMLLAVLAPLGLDRDTISDARLVASELVSNAIRHGRAPVEFGVRTEQDQLIFTVSDGETARPVARELRPDGIGGRGLHLVQALSTSWGTRPTGSGKTVWAALQLRPGQSPQIEN